MDNSDNSVDQNTAAVAAEQTEQASPATDEAQTNADILAAQAAQTQAESTETEVTEPNNADDDEPVDLSQGANTTDAARTDDDDMDDREYRRAEDSFDVFHWANEVDEVKNNVSVELFLFNKNYTPFRVRYSDALTASVKAMFMQEATGFIIKEADKGLECREYEKSDGEDKVIYRTKLSNVGRAETLIHLIEHEYRNIDSYTDHVDEFKKVKGILAKFSWQRRRNKSLLHRESHLSQLRSQRRHFMGAEW